jgi:predicted nucleic acid-binding protein
MFLLDTNVLSVMMDEPLPRPVAEWLAGTPFRFLYTTTVCQAEILAGIATLAEGRRRLGLEAAARTLFGETLAGKIWPFDTQARKRTRRFSPAAKEQVARLSPPT